MRDSAADPTAKRGDNFARVVVADDEIHILDLVASIIEDLGFEVTRAANGEQALRAVNDHQPRLVISDVMMPHLRGDDLCRQLKSRPETATILVVLVTSLPHSNVAECAADAYIEKPFAVEQLEAVVGGLMGAG